MGDVARLGGVGAVPPVSAVPESDRPNDACENSSGFAVAAVHDIA
jgi:hypothetical protein